MAAYNIIVLSKPVPGQEAEFEDWYTNQHIRDLLKVPGVTTAQRFRVLEDRSANTAHQYVARYEVETDDLAAMMALISARLGGPEMPMSEAFDMATATFLVVEPVTEKLNAG